KIISLKKPLQIGLCNKALPVYKNLAFVDFMHVFCHKIVDHHLLGCFFLGHFALYVTWRKE
uniref:hypothetical protein n=1 Tax=Acinetobacter variabilis TaxID=70346 RepID=UPI0028A88278